MVYEVDGENLKIYNANFKSLRIIEKKGEWVSLECNLPDITLQKSKPWEKDYKGLAENILKARPDYEVMLMKSSPEIPEILKYQMVTEAFADAFLKSTKKDFFQRQ